MNEGIRLNKITIMSSSPSPSSSTPTGKRKPNVCPSCGSSEFIVKQGQSYAKNPKQKIWCKRCKKYSVVPLATKIIN